MRSAQIEAGGQTRDYLVVAPANAADLESLPLLLVLHGATQTMADAESWGYDAVATDPGAVVVYPQAEEVDYGTDGTWTAWNAGNEPATGFDDMAFVSALLDRMEDDYPIDPQRVFIAGASNGGQMAYRVACEEATRVAGVAVMSGALLVDCAPDQPVSVIDIHGTADDMIPVSGGGDGCGKQDGGCPPLADTMQHWRQIDGCTGDPAESAADLTETKAWASCRDGTGVTFIQAIGAGHDLQGIQINVPSVTWEFLLKHARASGAM